MTPLEFQKKHRAELEAFLKTELGVGLLDVLRGLRMPPTCDNTPHAANYRLGAIAGYEQCISNILGLSLVPKTAAAQVKQTYGVPDKPEPKPEAGA